MKRTVRGVRASAGWLAVASLTALTGCQAAGPAAAPSPSVPAPAASVVAGASPSASPSPSVMVTSLRPGARGPQVLALQQRLVELGFWLGTPDGRYGESTMHAVTAFQKAHGIRRDGIAGPSTQAILRRAARPTPRSTSGRLVEIDLRRQLLMVVSGGSVLWAIDTSTGAVAGTTPKGHHEVYREVDGYRHAPLGVLYRPKYFHEGVAVHGFSTVPAYPASHGCVRVTYPAMDFLWSGAFLRLGTAVWVY